MQGRAAHRGGFTLIELLTVIAIIMLLIGLLLPATFALRQTVLRSMCGENLHQIGIALTAYATHYHNAYPPFGSSASDRRRNYYLVESGGRGDWQALWAARFITDEEAFFCPATRSNAHRFDTAANPWPGDTVRTGYSRRYLDPGQGDRLHVSRVGDARALAADLVVAPAHLAYQHDLGVNVLYGDGAVEFRTNALDLFAEAGITGPSAGNDQLDRVWNGLDHDDAP